MIEYGEVKHWESRDNLISLQKWKSLNSHFPTIAANWH